LSRHRTATLRELHSLDGKQIEHELAPRFGRYSEPSCVRKQDRLESRAELSPRPCVTAAHGRYQACIVERANGLVPTFELSRPDGLVLFAFILPVSR
jgi:hypothetical protein